MTKSMRFTKDIKNGKKKTPCVCKKGEGLLNSSENRTFLSLLLWYRNTRTCRTLHFLRHIQAFS